MPKRQGKGIDTDKLVAAMKYSYGTHEAALKAFHEMGMPEARVYCGFTSAELREALTERTGQRVGWIDMTAKVPTTADGDIGEFLSIMARCQVKGKERDDVGFFFVRTIENTPAFLHQTVFNEATETWDRAVGHEKPDLFDCAWGVVAIHNGSSHCLPARITAGNAGVTAGAMLSLMNVGYHDFKCALCNVSMVVWREYEGVVSRGLSPMLIMDCDHVYHPDCVAEHFMTGKYVDNMRCVQCGTLMPMSPALDTPRSEADAAAVCPATMEASQRASPLEKTRSCTRAIYNANVMSTQTNIRVQLTHPPDDSPPPSCPPSPPPPESEGADAATAGMAQMGLEDEDDEWLGVEEVGAVSADVARRRADVHLVMDHTGVDFDTALAALKQAGDGEVVNAIMSIHDCAFGAGAPQPVRLIEEAQPELALPIVPKLQYTTLGFYSNSNVSVDIKHAGKTVRMELPVSAMNHDGSTHIYYLQVTRAHVTDDDGSTVSVIEGREYRPFLPMPENFRCATQSELDRHCRRFPDARGGMDWNAMVHMAVERAVAALA